MATVGTSRRSRDARGCVALPAHLLDALLQLLDLVADDPAVRLELRLARAARADAALRAREVRPQPRQARQLVLELRQLDLEAALVGPRVLGKDVEDQPAAVEHLDAEQALQRLLLVGRDLVVRDEQREAGLGLGLHQLLGLALADVPVGVDVAAVLPFRADHLGARCRGQVGELGQRFLGGPACVLAGIDGNEEGTLHRRHEVDHPIATGAHTKQHTGSTHSFCNAPGCMI